MSSFMYMQERHHPVSGMDAAALCGCQSLIIAHRLSVSYHAIFCLPAPPWAIQEQVANNSQARFSVTR